MVFDLSVLSLVVMTLRQFEKETAKKQDKMRKTPHYASEHTKQKVQDKQPTKTGKDKNLLLVRRYRATESCEKVVSVFISVDYFT